jgi:hypothetical protein
MVVASVSDMDQLSKGLLKQACVKLLGGSSEKQVEDPMHRLPQWSMIVALVVLFAFEVAGLLWYHIH